MQMKDNIRQQRAKELRQLATDQEKELIEVSLLQINEKTTRNLKNHT